MTNNEKLLTDYIIGRTKKTIGNALLIVAPALLVGDLIARATTRYDFQNRDQKSYPTALTYFGLAALVVAIPTKIGFTKKIKSVVNECNRGSAITCNKSGNQKFDVVTNVYGTGMRLKLK